MGCIGSMVYINCMCLIDFPDALERIINSSNRMIKPYTVKVCIWLISLCQIINIVMLKSKVYVALDFL